MRYLFGALFLASCTMLAPSPTQDQSVGQPPLVIHSLPQESEAEVRKPKPKPAPGTVSEISSCAALDAGDLKETIKAKLDCITENAK
ncbi:hypothetical protein SAMN05216386_0689 [Nitrosospira briensis]|uniref:Uncharacterized protein n=1 Tax=Nitrosospira briensis TaxID=35799 RepID=A0A1I4YGE7_9PROT|nr:hypothetical protein [Nitrosospira briensis]SFN37121.1 hypothetical protein SAMN05216386_0689 [Nitrosospira briensis]